MSRNHIKTFLFAMLLIFAGNGYAQKNIIISESLAANSKPLKVKMGTQKMGKIWSFKFGDYEVANSKNGWTTTTNKSNLFNTKTDTKSTEKFAFTLSNKTGDFARVNAANNIEVKVLKEIELSTFLSIGENELLLDSRNFTAFININKDTTETWVLYMNVITGNTVDNGGTAFLSNSDRKIHIISTTSNKNGTDSRTFPSLGYEFFENEQPICALQYFGGGAFGMNKNIVWIHDNLDSELKLILAAAMTSILQLKN
ncbi:MAG: hypothetical protein KAH68_08320 [Draconibacterium sp.]|nr:hypothetical protein [Draconibacterium sp.]